MKVLRLIHSVNPAEGGTVAALASSSIALQKMGHVIEIASGDLPGDEWVKACPFTLHALGGASMTYGYSRLLKQWLRQHVHEFDVVIIEGIWQYHAVAAADACRRTRIPYFVYAHGMLDPWFRRTYPLKHIKKLVYWLMLLRTIFRDAAGVIFTVEEERRQAQGCFPLYKCREIVASLGIADGAADLERQKEKFLGCWPQLRHRPFSLFVGRLNPKKGVDILIRAFARVYGPRGTCPDDRHSLVIVGPDETGWQPMLEALATECSIREQVIFTGQLLGDEKWGAYAAADCFVLPSHQENFGMVVAEALSASLPVLISDKVNIFREVVADAAGKACADHVDEFSVLMHDWAVMSPEEKKKMAIQARACFLKRFEIGQCGRRIEEVLLHAKP